MASPQKENGYTPIANEILEHLVKLPLNGTQWRIISTVWRYTYGFSRKDHDLSLGFVANALECSRKQAQREVNRLVEFNILIVEKEPSFNRSRSLSFNKDYTEYKIDTCPLNRLQGTNQTTEQSPNQTTREGSNQTTKKTKNKYKTNNSDNCPYEQIRELFNSTCVSLPSIRGIGKSRSSKVFARWKDIGDINVFKELFIKTENSDFLSGRDGKWKCSFDWLMENDKNYCKVLEGNYNSKPKENEERIRW